MPDLSVTEQERYSRHLRLPGFGPEGQLRLKAARVLLVGAGGLGCPAGLYLAAAGVGTIGVMDFDTVSLSNLQRQVAHTTAGIGEPKVDSLIRAMRALNPLLTFCAYPVALSPENIAGIFEGYDLILDCTDNFRTRFLIADASFLLQKVLVSGSLYQFQAQISLFLPGEGPCYRCLYAAPPRLSALGACDDIGILGVLPGMVGLMMATETLKYLAKLGETLQGKLLRYDALAQDLRPLPVTRDPACTLCGDSPTITQLAWCDIPETVCQTAVSEIDIATAQTWLREGTGVLDVREAWEFAAGHLPKAVNFPLSQLQQGQLAPLSGVGRWLVVCQKGIRSAEAVTRLRNVGVTHCFSLQGGLNAWLSVENSVQDQASLWEQAEPLAHTTG